MAKPTNHAPATRTDENDAPIQYPEGNVVGIVDTVGQLESVIDALTDGGFLRSEIAIIYGEAAAERLNASTGRTGFTDLAMRLAAALGMPDDETMLKESYEQALRDGRFVVLVLAPTEDRKNLAARLLENYGGHFVNFLGRFTIEALVRRSPAS
ncbi:MAG TPA: hypothetical protein VFK04_18440 [Gemmatimonadaceae bacterium]|jgi:hypothetical protein|nr:hypothetical protein [Gemmatimonadaceae bacterium]